MSKQLICDVCKQQTEKHVGKLFYTPTNRSQSANGFHNNYQLHLDVGICCEGKLKKSFRWTRRVSAKVYRARGKST